MRTWVKLHVSILDDPKLADLPDDLYRVFVNLLAIGGRVDDDGRLGSSKEIAYWLRMDLGTAVRQLDELQKKNVTCNKKGSWSLKNWNDYQSKAPSADREAVRQRVQKSRQNKQKSLGSVTSGNDDVTSLHANGNDPRKEKNREEDKEHSPAPKPARVPPPENHKPDPLKDLAAVWEDASGIKLESIPTKQRGPMYWNPLGLMLKTANGTAAEELRAAIRHLRAENMTISDPNSVLKTFNSLHGAAKTGAGKSTFREVA